MLVRERNYLTASSLINPARCPWSVMYPARSTKAFINTVSLPPDAFDMLLRWFARYYIIRSDPGRRGRQCKFLSKNRITAACKSQLKAIFRTLCSTVQMLVDAVQVSMVLMCCSFVLIRG
ncbi:TPA: hypothetical protein N0F65_009668 [Lagenidium giganteum]|uniref:Uncharacterized protein n=1 Tax=Lagenidium giganteum TaxID=4803 RepID=A0AAV2YSK3_9STRA|nr:TPA: hypothetical protein N0F65_009668 [Lagenidium giganteum]